MCKLHIDFFSFLCIIVEALCTLVISSTLTMMTHINRLLKESAHGCCVGGIQYNYVARKFMLLVLRCLIKPHWNGITTGI